MKNLKKKNTCLIIMLLVFSMLMPLSVFPVFSANGMEWEQVEILSNGQATDVFNGVSILYELANSDYSPTYSCAAFVKRYYQTIYGIELTNLLHREIPRTNSGAVISTKMPSAGDIGYEETALGHWFVVKQVHPDGSVTIAEQNYKIKSSGKIYAAKNRKISAETLAQTVGGDSKYRFFTVTGVSPSENADNPGSDYSDLIAAAGKAQDNVLIRIQSPLKVRISYQGDTISNAGPDSMAAASWGNITAAGDNTLISLAKGKIYQFSMNGSGNGTLSLTVGYADSANKLIGIYSLDSLKLNVTPSLIINAMLDESGVMYLNIDEDGDGIVDTFISSNKMWVTSLPDVADEQSIGFVGTDTQYPFTVIADGTQGVAFSDVSPKCSAGTVVTLQAIPRTGYQFFGWASDDGIVFENQGAAQTSFVMPGRAVSVQAIFVADSVLGYDAGAMLQFKYGADFSATATVPYYKNMYGNDVIVKLSLYIPRQDAFAQYILDSNLSNLLYKNNQKAFNDIPNTHWAKEAISFITAREIFIGVGDYEFAPESAMTKAMFVRVLANIENVNLSAYIGSVPYADVRPSDWYCQALAWAVDKGILDGAGGYFYPGDPITREEMALILNRYIIYKNLTLSSRPADPFADIVSVSPQCLESVEAMQAYGIMNGMGENLFCPAGYATRAQVAQLFQNFIKALFGEI